MTDDQRWVEDDPHRLLASLRDICASLSTLDDDVVKMFALRVTSMARALEDSVLAPPEEVGLRG
jgi:hypothetical protein